MQKSKIDGTLKNNKQQKSKLKGKGQKGNVESQLSSLAEIIVNIYLEHYGNVK